MLYLHQISPNDAKHGHKAICHAMEQNICKDNAVSDKIRNR